MSWLSALAVAVSGTALVVSLVCGDAPLAAANAALLVWNAINYVYPEFQNE